MLEKVKKVLLMQQSYSYWSKINFDLDLFFKRSCSCIYFFQPTLFLSQGSTKACPSIRKPGLGRIPAETGQYRFDLGCAGWPAHQPPVQRKGGCLPSHPIQEWGAGGLVCAFMFRALQLLRSPPRQRWLLPHDVTVRHKSTSGRTLVGKATHVNGWHGNKHRGSWRRSVCYV